MRKIYRIYRNGDDFTIETKKKTGTALKKILKKIITTLLTLAIMFLPYISAALNLLNPSFIVKAVGILTVCYRGDFIARHCIQNGFIVEIVIRKPKRGK